MALSRVKKLIVCNNPDIDTPEGFDRAWTIHEALTKIDLITYVEITIDDNIEEMLASKARYVYLDSDTVYEAAYNKGICSVNYLL